MLSRRSHGHEAAGVSNAARPHQRQMAEPSSSSSSSSTNKTGSRFSFDQLFRRMRTKSTEETSGETPTSSRDQRSAQDSRHKFHKTAGMLKPAQRPPPIATSAVGITSAKPTPSEPPQLAESTAASASVRLCQSPGGRANVSLAIPVTPTSTKQRRRSRGSSVCSNSRKTTSQLRLDHGDGLQEDNRSSFSLGTWRDSVVLDSDEVPVDNQALILVSAETLDLVSTAVDVAIRPDQRQQAQQPRRLWLARALLPDVRTLVSLSSRSTSSLRVARQYISQLLRVYMFEIRATKWAAYFLVLVSRARGRRTISSVDALSVRFAVCAYVRREAETRNRLKHAQEKLFQRKMTEYRVAMQCICGTSVMKYGRKGKPHVTHLMIENGDTFKWTSAKLLSSKKLSAKKSIALSEILAVRAGPTTDVLAKAMQKGTLRLQDAKCTLSLVTQKRTFDIKARNTAEREWLLRSFSFLVQLAKEHEKQVAQQVELAIMKKMETLPVWKHGRRGRPHKTRLFINRFGELSWQGRSGDTIQLEEIVSIEQGHATYVFQRSRNAGLTSVRTASRCFSLVTKSRSLDIETANEQQRDWYVVAFQYLMDKVHEKTAAIKREKAEKQLKMIQELCGGGGDNTGAEPGNIGISIAVAPHA